MDEQSIPWEEAEKVLDEGFDGGTYSTELRMVRDEEDVYRLADVSLYKGKPRYVYERLDSVYAKSVAELQRDVLAALSKPVVIVEYREEV